MSTIAWVAWDDPWMETPEGEVPAVRGGAAVYTPKSQRTDVCVLWIHGGSFQWQNPDEESYTFSCSRFAASTGLTVVMPDHLLSGEGRPFHAPQIIGQLLSDFAWLREFDPVTSEKRTAGCRVILVGDSSGGTQVVSMLLMLARYWPEGVAVVPCLLLVSPALDLTCRSHTYVSNAFSDDHKTGDAFFSEGVEVTRYLYRDCGWWYTGSEEGLTECTFSPYWLARGYDDDLLAAAERFRVPMFMCMGAPEALTGEVLDFAQRLRGRLPMEVWLHEGMFHCWCLQRSKHPFPSRDAAFYNMVDFVHRVIGEPSAWPESPELKEGIHYYIDEWW